MDTGGTPIKVTINKSGSNTAALNELYKNNKNKIELRQSKYLNNLKEQDHHPVKGKMHQAKRFGEFHSAHKIIKGVEPWRILKKEQHIFLGEGMFYPPLICSMV